VPAYVFVEWFQWLLPIGLGSAAGTMIWMVIAELIPDAIKVASP
jgi:ZIP family zinc transporter